MTVFNKVHNNVVRIDFNKEIATLLGRKDYQAFIIGLNQIRLYTEGTDVEGKEIRTFRAEQGEVYNRFTIEEKDRKGQPFDRVTLKDTGKFYETFIVDVEADGFAISANTEKPEGDITDNVNVDSVLGLEDITPLTEKLIPDIQDVIRKVLLK